MSQTSLTPLDHASRLARLADAPWDGDVEALIVTHPTNVRYLVGFTGSAGFLILTRSAVTFVTDGRYGEQAQRQLAGLDVRIEVSGEAQREIAAEALRAAGVERLGFEAATIGWQRHRTLEREWFPHVELVATASLVESLRSVKEPGEIDRIRLAAGIADRALAGLRSGLSDGPTEREFGLALDAAMRSLGASGPSFETIVASGPNSAVPHHRPTDRQIVDGDLVVLDFGARVDGYCSDMTRTLMVGEPSVDQRRLLDVVLEAQSRGVAAVADAVPARDVDASCRAVIAAAGWGDRFTHGTGHGVGLDIHEAPAVGRTSGDTLAAGQVVTVEPGVYLPGVGGVRVEDSVVVAIDGCAPVTLTPKDFSIGSTWQPSPPQTSRPA